MSKEYRYFLFNNYIMSDDFQTSIKAWVEVDNELKILNNRARELREERREIQDEILEYVETNKLSNATVNISDGQLKFANVRQQSTLTYTHVKNCLMDCIQSEEDVKKIMKYIKQKREVKYVPDIKRSYKKD